MTALWDVRAQYSELDLVECSALRTVALGVGFVVGLGAGWLLGDAWTGAGAGAIVGPVSSWRSCGVREGSRQQSEVPPMAGAVPSYRVSGRGAVSVIVRRCIWRNG